MHTLKVMLATVTAAMAAALPAAAQDTIKVGEINSYKAVPAFLEPYKKGWELAVEEVNKAGGINGKKIEVSRATTTQRRAMPCARQKNSSSRENVVLLTGASCRTSGLRCRTSPSSARCCSSPPSR